MAERKGGFLSALIVILIIAGSIFMLYTSAGNRLITKEEAVTASWAEVQNQYQRRLDLIPNLVATVKGYAEHEKSTFEAVTQARANATNTQINVSKEILDDPQAFAKYQQAQDALGSSLQRLLMVTENYPELKADENFLALQNQLEGTENRITVARQRFNTAAQDYNTAIRKFPGSIIAGLKHMESKTYFAASAEAQSAPTVSF